MVHLGRYSMALCSMKRSCAAQYTLLRTALVTGTYFQVVRLVTMNVCPWIYYWFPYFCCTSKIQFLHCRFSFCQLLFRILMEVMLSLQAAFAVQNISNLTHSVNTVIIVYVVWFSELILCNRLGCLSKAVEYLWKIIGTGRHAAEIME